MDPGFFERGSENLKKGVWNAAPEAIGIYIEIIHFEHMFKHISNQVSVASYTTWCYQQKQIIGLGFKVDLSNSILPQ